MSRIGRRVLRFLCAAALFSCVFVTLAAPPGGADPRIDPSPAAGVPVRVSSRATVAIASWTTIGADSFRVQLFTGDGAAVRALDTVGGMAVLTGLTPSTDYRVTVTRLLDDGAEGLDETSTTFRTPERPFAQAAPQLRLSSDGEARLTASWNGAARARFEVQFSTEASFAEAKELVVRGGKANFPALELGTRYYARVRAVDRTDQALSTWSATESGLPAAGLNVATYNIQKAKGHAWSTRRPALVRTILGENLDVVGLQEATPQTVASGRRQYTDLVQALGANWALTNSGSKTTGEVRTIYNSRRVALISQGFQGLAGTEKFGVLRYVTWAVFEQRATKKRFIFVNTHLPYQKSAAANRVRGRATRQLVARIRQVNDAQLPVIIVGDFNSHLPRTLSNPVYGTIIRAGFTDPMARAEQYIRANLKTVNEMQRRAQLTRGRMIDHIFSTRMRVTQWEVVARLSASGRFVGTIPSDHNMVRATVFLP